MNRSRFLTLSLILTTVFLFFKIYHHNKIVTLMYTKQRIERMQEKLHKKKDNLLVDLYKAKDQRLIREKAREQLGMRSLKPSQIVTFSTRA